MKSGTSFTYKVGLFLVAVMMVILPLIYLALTVAVWWGVYEFAVNDFVEIMAWPTGAVVKLFCAMAPLFAGVTAGVFMIKPLFASRAASMQPLAVDRQTHPTIFEVTSTVASWVGSTMPHRIEVDCSINASARLESGWAGFTGGKLVLTLGMPLVACLTQRELAGVIAHELGHFRQGAGMRFTYVIRQINHWFARVIYERDAWDQALDNAQEGSGGWVAMGIAMGRLAVWLSRRILWLLMMTGHGVCALLLRQMEYDADAAETQVAGSDAFESTMFKLTEVSQINGWVHRELYKNWHQTHRMPDNLPLVVRQARESVSEEQREQIRQAAVTLRTGFFDTHPSPSDRVGRAHQLNEPGVGFANEPATGFFEHFVSLSHLATLAYYEDVLKVPTGKSHLVPVAPQEG